jgi:hypothetical protein
VLGWGGGELLLAHRPGLFVKPRISGHVKPRLGHLRSGVARHAVGTGRRHGFSPLPLGSAPSTGTRTTPDIAEDHEVGEGWLGFVKRSFRTRTLRLTVRNVHLALVVDADGHVKVQTRRHPVVQNDNAREVIAVRAYNPGRRAVQVARVQMRLFATVMEATTDASVPWVR